MEDDLGWKMTLGGRRPWVEDDLQWILACCLVRFKAFFVVQVAKILPTFVADFLRWAILIEDSEIPHS